MKHSIFMTFEVKISGHVVVVDAYGVAHGDDNEASEKVLRKIQYMIRESYRNADSIELKRVMVEDHEE